MTKKRYVVFDVETPNRYNNRMSAIGISVVEDGRIVDEYFSLVDPEQPFDRFNTQLTGISEETVSGAPAFPELWAQIEPLLSSGILVAHNASFDMGVLRRCLESYEIVWKPYVKAVCTVIMGRSLLPGISHKLNDMCDYYGIDLKHHQADSDSRAAAEILIRYMDSGAAPEKYLRTYRMNSDRLTTKTDKGVGESPDYRAQHGERATQLQRISYYEAILQQLSAAVRSDGTAIELLKSLRSKADELGAYLESDDWKQDFADDEAGHFPPELRRGVLSEDGIFNLLEAYRERTGGK